MFPTAVKLMGRSHRRVAASVVAASLLVAGPGALAATASPALGSDAFAAAALSVPGFATSPPPLPSTCPKETYPAAGTPDQAGAKGSSLYEIPFTGSLDGGQLTVPGTNGVISLILGPTYGSLCGLLGLPSLLGAVPQDAVVIANPVPVSLTIPGLTISSAQVNLTAQISAAITGAASNGGLNLDLKATFDATLEGNVLGIPLPGLFNCGTAAGDLAQTNYPPAELATLEQQHPSYGWTQPINFTTSGTAGSVQGQPVTGPATAGQTVLVANSFPYPPAVLNYGPNCSGLTGTAITSLFNSSLGLNLPAPPGRAYFSAPAKFAIHIDPGG